MVGRVAVVGGGIAGLATALALRQRGADVAVYERAPALREVGAGISVWPNASRALSSLGVLDAVAGSAGRAESVQILRSDGRELARFLTARPDAPSLCVRRPDLLAALADALGPGVVRLGAEVTAVHQRPGSVVLEMADGAEEPAELVVGADGLRSRVREALIGSVRPTYRGYAVWRAVGPAAGWPAADACEVWGRGARFGMFPVGGGEAYWYVCASGRPRASEAGDPSGGGATPHGEALAVVEGWHPAISETVGATPPDAVARHDVYDRPVRGRRVAGRVALVGDAAHGMTPDLGQGGAQGLVDAVRLADALDRGRDVPAALARFEREQVRRTAPVALQSRFAGWVGQLDGAPARLRDAATAAAPSSWFGAAFTAAF